MIFSVELQRTSALVHEWDNAVNIRIRGQICFCQFLRNVARGSCRTVHSADNCDVISCSGFAVGPPIAHERSFFGWRSGMLNLGAEFVVLIRAFRNNVVNMHPVAWMDGAGRVSDRLAVLDDRSSFRDL